MSREALRRTLIRACEDSLLEKVIGLMVREIKARFDPSKWTVEKFINWLIQKFKDEIPVFATIDDIKVRLRPYFEIWKMLR